MATAVHTPHHAAYAPSKKSAARETRRRERLKMSLPVEVRPFDARFVDIADVGEVTDFTRDGLYFATHAALFRGHALTGYFPVRQENFSTQKISRLHRSHGRTSRRRHGNRGAIPAVAIFTITFSPASQVAKRIKG